MRWSVRLGIKRGRVCAFNQFHKSKICDDISKIISEELNVIGSIYDYIEAYLKFKNNHFELIGKENGNQFNDFRDADEGEKEKQINEKISQLPIHQLMKQINLDERLWDFDAVGLYPSAMGDEKVFTLGLKQDMHLVKI